MVAVSIQRDTDVIIGDYTDNLRRHLRARLGCESDVEDLVQKAYLKFLQAAERGLEIQNPKAYLMTIAHNLLYHHYKTRERSTISGDIDVDTLHAENTDLESATTISMRSDRINRAWRELSPKCQQALHLRWRKRLRVREIATEMSLSHGMVKKYLAQGLSHFRKRLGRYVD